MLNERNPRVIESALKRKEEPRGRKKKQKAVPLVQVYRTLLGRVTSHRRETDHQHDFQKHKVDPGNADVGKTDPTWARRVAQPDDQGWNPGIATDRMRPWAGRLTPETFAFSLRGQLTRTTVPADMWGSVPSIDLSS